MNVKVIRINTGEEVVLLLEDNEDTSLLKIQLSWHNSGQVNWVWTLKHLLSKMVKKSMLKRSTCVHL